MNGIKCGPIRTLVCPYPRTVFYFLFLLGFFFHTAVFYDDDGNDETLDFSILSDNVNSWYENGKAENPFYFFHGIAYWYYVVCLKALEKYVCMNFCYRLG